MDLEALADAADKIRRKEGMRMPYAVWKVLRAEGLANRPRARELARKILKKLQQRSVARRKKNKERSRMVIHDMFMTMAARGGDPED